MTIECSGGTWDFGVAPYEPMPRQWLKRWEGLLWKLRQLDYELDIILPKFRKGNNLPKYI